MTADTIECPFCAEVIKTKAKKCRYCDEFLRQDVTDETIIAEHVQRLEGVGKPDESGSAPAKEASSPPPAEEKKPESDAPVVTSPEENEAQGEIDPLEDLYNQLQKMPDSPEKEMVINTLQQLAEEAEKGDGAEDGKITDMIKTVTGILPDVAEITVNTIVNPVSGVMSLIKKVGEFVSKKDDDEGEKEKSPEEAAAAKQPEEGPVGVDTEDAADALEEVQDKMEDLPDSPAKKLVEETIEKLEEEAKKEEEESHDGKSTVEKIVENVAEVAEVLPDAATAVMDAVNKVSGATKKK